LQFFARLGQFGFALVDFLRIAFLHGFVQVSLTLADFVLGFQHLVLAFFLQARVGAMCSCFAQSFFKTGNLTGIVVGASLFKLLADGLLLGRAARQFRRRVCRHEWSSQQAADSKQGERGKKFHKELHDKR